METPINLISVKEFAETNGLRRQTVFKVIKRLGIEPEKSRGNTQNRGQVISYIAERDARLILEALTTNRKQLIGGNDEEPYMPEATLYDVGVFYLISLEPDYDLNRYKVGFSNNLNERLRQHKCSAPFAIVVKTWPCRRLWEKTAIECVTSDCEQLHTEVFRATFLSAVEEKCNRFFELMPRLTNNSEQSI